MGHAGMLKDLKGGFILSRALPFTCCVVLGKMFVCLVSSSGKWKFGHVCDASITEWIYFTHGSSFALCLALLPW